jgi:inorganic pyrophosphatase
MPWSRTPGWLSCLQRMNLIRLPPFPSRSLVRVVVETPKGSRSKLDYDPKLKIFRLKKTLPEGMVFPYDFGFIPQTLGADGDPLDALVLMPESVPPGCVVDGRLIGVIRAKQKEKKKKAVRNDRLIVVSATACEFEHFKTSSDLPEAMLTQLEQFFVTYNQLEEKVFKLEGVEGRQAALKIVQAARTKA